MPDLHHHMAQGGSPGSWQLSYGSSDMPKYYGTCGSATITFVCDDVTAAGQTYFAERHWLLRKLGWPRWRRIDWWDYERLLRRGNVRLAAVDAGVEVTT